MYYARCPAYARLPSIAKLRALAQDGWAVTIFTDWRYRNANLHLPPPSRPPSNGHTHT